MKQAALRRSTGTRAHKKRKEGNVLLVNLSSLRRGIACHEVRVTSLPSLHVFNKSPGWSAHTDWVSTAQFSALCFIVQFRLEFVPELVQRF